MTAYELTIALLHATASAEIISALKKSVKAFSGNDVSEVTFKDFKMEIQVNDKGRNSLFLITDLMSGKDIYGRKNLAGLGPIDITMIKNVIQWETS